MMENEQTPLLSSSNDNSNTTVVPATTTQGFVVQDIVDHDVCYDDDDRNRQQQFTDLDHHVGGQCYNNNNNTTTVKTIPRTMTSTTSTTTTTTTGVEYGTINSSMNKYNTESNMGWQKFFNRKSSSSSVTVSQSGTKMKTINEAIQHNPNIGHAAVLIRNAILGEQSHTTFPTLLISCNDNNYIKDDNDNNNNVHTTTTTITTTAITIFCYKVLSYRPFVTTYYCCAWLLVLLSFIEPPYWCRNFHWNDFDGSNSNCVAILTATGIPASDRTNNETDFSFNSTSTNITSLLSTSSTGIEKDSDLVEYYPNAYSALINEEQSFWIECFCVGIILLFVLVSIIYNYLQNKIYIHQSNHTSTISPPAVQVPTRTENKRIVTNTHIVQISCLFALTIGLLFNCTKYNTIFRLVLLASLCDDAQRDIQVLLKVIPDVSNVLFLLFLVTVLYAWFGCVIFLGTKEAQEHFSSLVESMWTLWICITTANYPDVMMLSYNNTRWTAIYFVSFMILSFFFFMNIILATVVNGYDSAIQNRKQQQSTTSRTNLINAFHLMDISGTGELSKSDCIALLFIFQKYFPELLHHHSSSIINNNEHDDEHDAKIRFAILDQDGNNTINEHEFMSLPTVLSIELAKESDYAPFIKRNVPSLWIHPKFQSFCNFIKSQYFERLIDFIVALNAIVVAIQSYPELAGQTVNVDPKYLDGSIDTLWEVFEAMFAVLYTIEALLKITILGWKTYRESAKNMFDFVITALSIGSTIIVYYPNEYSDSRIIRLILSLRVLRLLRLVTSIKRFQLVGSIAAEILPSAQSAILVLFFLLYTFAAIGMILYGGMISRDPNNPLSYLLLNTDFSDNSYWANNFNDMLSGMNVLFNLLVVNNWTECEIGFEAVTQAKWVRLFFLSFHIFGVVLINNLVVAVVINSFMVHLSYFRGLEESDEEVVGNGEAVLRHEKAYFDASVITGTRTFLSGMFIAKLRHNHKSDSFDSENVGIRDKDMLRQLFTQTSSM